LKKRDFPRASVFRRKKGGGAWGETNSNSLKKKNRILVRYDRGREGERVKVQWRRVNIPLKICDRREGLRGEDRGDKGKVAQEVSFGECPP